jgi:hypothetical protein
VLSKAPPAASPLADSGPPAERPTHNKNNVFPDDTTAEMRDEYVDFALLAGVHGLAVAVYLVSDLGIRVLGLFIFIELLTMLLLYCGAALFTEPESNVNDRETVAPAGPSYWFDRRFDADSRLSLGSLPPLRLKNLRFVVPSFLLGLLVVTGVGGALTLGEGLGGRSRASGFSLAEFFRQFAVFGEPLVAITSTLVIAAEGARFYRCHVTTGRYREWTTHMMLTPLVQYLFLALWASFLFVLYTILIFVVLGLGVAPIVGDSLGRTLSEGVVLVTGLVVKLGIEWGRVCGERELDVSFGSWVTEYFTPTPPDRGTRSSES